MNKIPIAGHYYTVDCSQSSFSGPHYSHHSHSGPKFLFAAPIFREKTKSFQGLQHRMIEPLKIRMTIVLKHDKPLFSPSILLSEKL